MDLISDFTLMDAIGWLAALLTLGTFAMKSMIRLRLMALAGMLCFAIYAAAFQIWPLLAVQVVLIPYTAYGLWLVFAMRRVVTHMTHEIEADYTVAKAYGKKRTFPAGSVIFEKGDMVDCLYYLAEGRVDIEGQNVTLDPGKIFGEMAFFTGTETRTATVRCIDDTVVYELNKKRFTRLQYDDHNFGTSVMSTITRRLIENAAQEKERKTG